MYQVEKLEEDQAKQRPDAAPQDQNEVGLMAACFGKGWEATTAQYGWMKDPKYDKFIFEQSSNHFKQNK